MMKRNIVNKTKPNEMYVQIIRTIVTLYSIFYKTMTQRITVAFVERLCNFISVKNVVNYLPIF